MTEEARRIKVDSRVQIIHTVQTPLGFFTLVVLVSEAILGLLASKATGIDFTILIVSMTGLLFLLVVLVAVTGRGRGRAFTRGRPEEQASFFRELVSNETVRSIEHDARTNEKDHVRIACAHTVWSCRPDRAQPLLEDALHDLAPVVREHSRAILDKFYR